ncbi:hypothetical protein AB0395_45385 [Streptosporangium sp. NPDC051023]|uniref:hypothetical protein n=1 Tax=Streptosporangium sp. NPDC051023 TaxID=3155410 RepID=UPI00344BC25D
MIPSGMFGSSRAMVQHLRDLVDTTPPQEPAVRYALPSWPFTVLDVAHEDETLERLACLTAVCASPWDAACEAFGGQPTGQDRFAQERRWRIFKTTYHRRGRNRRG